MATKYGYMIYVFRVHRHGEAKSPLVLGQLAKRDDETQKPEDALTVLYGALRAMTAQRYSGSNNRHIHAKNVTGLGRTVRFSVSVGQSGQRSEFYGPADTDKPVFERKDEHIESNVRRGLVVAPSGSSAGLLILEVHGRSGAKSLLVPLLSKLFRHHTGLILNVASVVDEAALQKFIAEAHAHEITLRRTGLPRDIADAVEMAPDDAPAGKMELKITPGKLRRFQQAIIGRLRGEDSQSRRALLQMHGLQFDELSVGMTVGERRTTLTVTADNVPTFVYDIRSRDIPDDALFYREVLAAVREMASAVGVNVRPGWEDGAWSPEAQAFSLTLPQEGPDSDSTSDEP
jgi:hypothetical protein